ncbi:DedA family protein [Blochmannia endosymbiont of Polyrhachis (Hedomyrma) turneri]|uniref:DedA family protein n=1 Tax=Blochmannia endosymbiont of Polyrhachis (Hedomyrma) turneri TaxID=1505596 RepID=UPI00061A6294|nr:DedA family protein [Blochmannia endosymbiont of Polyrhachis (Hedomyrma) turneri]AKC59645.1 inner membrane protein YqjA [Blochmannia endosymbiont of Polyrhachis (Hedomyrma) turneri]
MRVFEEVLYAFWNYDCKSFSDVSNLVTVVYLLAFIVLFLENGILVTSFLPGDTLLIFFGMLIAKGILSFPLTVCILTVAASLGSWVGYIQGRWLESAVLKNSWFAYLPQRYRCLAFRIFDSYGLFALFIGRFVVFVRTLLPMLAALSGFHGIRFHFFNWVSAFCWILILTVLGFFLGKTDLIQSYDHQQVVYFLLIVIFFVVVLIGIIRVIFFKISHVKK